MKPRRSRKLPTARAIKPATQRAQLRRLLKTGYERERRLTLEVVREWDHRSEEVWRRDLD